MGGAVSTGQDNDDLVDNLMESGYIRTKKVERVFRAVDRADYVLPSHREGAYKDLAWKHGNIHLSAPCVYSEVMEGLSLEPELSFLNLGSGTGYLSTMAGLILNQHGTNHGIELHEDCLKYAYERLEEFKQKSLALDEFDFCEPLFVQGNCLSIVPGRQYDRVYCGAACPESHEAFIKQFVRIGGILVMPFKDHLLRIQRVDENTWSQHTMLPVSFATLVVPTAAEHNLLHLPECDPLTLQELCRGKIRNRLRQNVWNEHPDLETKKSILPGRQRLSPPQRALRRFVIPIFEESDEALSDDEFSGRARLLLNVDAHPGEAITTTLELVRAVIQPNQNENRQNWQEANRVSRNSRRRVESVNLDLSNESNEVRCETSKEQTETTNEQQSPENNSVANSSESTERNTESQSQTQKQNSKKSGKAKYVSEKYLNVNESDSDQEQENAFAQRKKIAKREKTDSGIVEDVNLTNEDGSSSSNTNQSDSEIVDPADSVDAMDVDLYDITANKPSRNVYTSYSASSDTTPNEEVTIAHYVSSSTLTNYIKEKIHQLPLPFSLKLYINYNRKL